MNLLEIPHEIIPVNLLKAEQTSDWYRKINPLGTVPAIQTRNGEIVWQSLAIIDYLHRENVLLPDAPFERARCMQIANTICSEIQPLQNLSVLSKIEQLAGSTAKSEWAIHHNKSKLGIIDKYLVSREAGYAVGDKVSLADICIVPQLYSARRFGIDIENEFPNLWRIAKNVERLTPFIHAHAHSQADCPEDIRVLGVKF